MIGAMLFAVILYVITIELWHFVARQSRRAVPRQTKAAGSGGRPFYHGENQLNPLGDRHPIVIHFPTRTGVSCQNSSAC